MHPTHRLHTRCRSQADNDPSGDEPSTSETRSGPSPSLADPVQTITWGGRLPSRRRAVASISTATVIALVGNLGGVTSGLLGLDGGAFAGDLRLDVIIPVKGFKRCVDYSQGFEFKYPAGEPRRLHTTSWTEPPDL